MPRLISASFLLAILYSLPVASIATAAERHATFVIDGNSGKVLKAESADEPRYPASLTKMMTLYMVFDLIEKGRLSKSGTIKITQQAASAAPSKLDLEPGEEISIDDAIKALVTKSANDIAVAIAQHIGGSEDNFARLMTLKARQIGMKSTTFRNASGLPHPGQLTTARDMVTLGLRLQDDFPDHYRVFATTRFAYAGNTYRTHNSLLLNYRGADGIKTGYTRASGFNLVSSVRQGNKHVVAAVFGGETAGKRNALMRTLLTKALARATIEKTRKPLLVASPRPAERPKPQQAVKAPPEPKPVETAAAVLQATPPPQSAPQKSAPTHKIEIASVRRVIVAPRVAGKAPDAENADFSTDTPAAIVTVAGQRAANENGTKPIAVAAASAKLDFRTFHPEDGERTGMTAPSAATPPADTETVVAKRVQPSVRTPSTLQQQAALLKSAHGLHEPAAAPDVTIPMLLAATDAKPAFRLGGPAERPAPELPVPATAAIPSGFQIQVGAFGTAAEAERQTLQVRQRSGDLLTNYQPITQEVQKGNRVVYRARFAGFAAGVAAETCLELRRQKIDCFVMKSE